LIATLLSAADSFQLTVDSIMRGPELVGHSPRAVRWAGNGERVYFEWKRTADPIRTDLTRP
jgi:hypothetical protein